MKTRKVVFSNKKGGCGKTTLAILTAQELIDRGYKVLVVDCDSQHNTTSFYGATWEDEYSVASMLYKDVPAVKAIQHCEYGDIIPGDPKLSEADNTVRRGAGEFKHLLKSMKSVEGMYDFIIFDTATSTDVLLKNVLCVADYLIVPINGQYALDGIADYDLVVDEVIEFENEDLVKLGFVFNGYKGHVGVSRDTVSDAEEIADCTGTSMFETKIRATADCEKALTSIKVPLKRYNKRCKTQEDIEAFVTEMLRSIKKTPNGKDLVIKRAK